MAKLEIVRSACWLIIADEADDSGPLFWSNDDGWVGLYGADIYTDEEKAGLRLPIGGSWTTVGEVEAERARSRRDHPSSFTDLDSESRDIRKTNLRIIRGARYRAAHRKGKK